nr:MAG TPA: hypothetical protein [Caudoviricetes sp.]
MNYYKQFAEMLGLELGREFVITDLDGKRQDDNTYEITEDGISVKKPRNIGMCCRIPAIFTNVLDGKYKVVQVPWKPKFGEQYWSYSARTNQSCCGAFAGFVEDYAIWKSGNCFKTKEEAETKGKEIMEQLQKEYEKA